MRNSKAKLLKRIHLSHRAGWLSDPDQGLGYKALKRLYGNGVPLGLIMYTPRHELTRQGNWS